MITMIVPQRETLQPTFSRRRFLGTAVAAGVTAAGLSACQVQTENEPSGENDDDGALKIPDPVGELPDSDVTIKWMSGGPGAKSEVFEALFPAYEETHPSITITYNELPNDKIGEVLPLQIRNNNADDVFQVLNAQVPLSQLVNTNKVAALDDVVPDFAAWKEAMPDGVIVPGVDEFNGKTYQLRMSTDRRLPRMVLFNTELMDKAGYDPVGEQLTLETLREAAKKITEQGNGEIYGLMTPGDNPTDLVELNGGPPNFDWKTGSYAYTDDMYVEVLELFKAMVDDGSVFPGWATLQEQQARGQFPLGRAGIMLNGPWNFPVWVKDFPDFDYGVGRPPAPADHGYRHYVAEGGNGYAVFINAPDDNKAVAGELLHFFGTEEGQEFWALSVGSADPAWSESAVKAARESGELSEQDETAFTMYDELVRLMPSPVIGNPEQEQVRLLQKPVTTKLPQVAQGYLTGQISDLRKALRDLNDAEERSLDDAIAEAKKQGANVSRDDWVFANWDPAKDYTAADYESR